MRHHLVQMRLLTSRQLRYGPCRMMSTSITESLSAPPPTGFSLLSSRRLLAISGPESTNYLQGAVTANISQHASEGVYAAFLTATGRVLNDVFIYPFQETEGRYKGDRGWLIEVDAEEVQSLAQRIRRYRLRSNFEIRVLPQTERAVWSIWDDSAENFSSNKILSYVINRDALKGEMSFGSHLAPEMGSRLILPGNEKPDFHMEEFHEDYYRMRRYLKGVPEGQREILKERSLPQESNIDLMGGIDYRKGCYVGQELTIRTHHTGVVRKRILPVQIYNVDEKQPQQLTFNCDNKFGIEKIPTNTSIELWQKTGKIAGKFIAGLGNIGLGLCRLADITKVTNNDEEGNQQASNELKLEWKTNEGIKIVKAKAFIPKWHHLRVKM